MVQGVAEGKGITRSTYMQRGKRLYNIYKNSDENGENVVYISQAKRKRQRNEPKKNCNENLQCISIDYSAAMDTFCEKLFADWYSIKEIGTCSKCGKNRKHEKSVISIPHTFFTNHVFKETFREDITFCHYLVAPQIVMAIIYSIK